MAKETYKVKFLKYESKNGHVDYTIKVIGSKSKQFHIRDRYSSMRDYWKNMVKEFEDSVPPNFPPKKWFGNTGDDFLKQRMSDLEHFFNILLGDPKLAGSHITKSYLKQKTVRMSEKASPRNGKPEEEEEKPPVYVQSADKMLHEKKWRKAADTVTKAYIDINLGDDPPLPEEVKKKAMKYAESIGEILNNIPYVSKILEVPKRGPQAADDVSLDLIKTQQHISEWLGEKMQGLVKSLSNEDNGLYAVSYTHLTLPTICSV
eukprot:TRINITY_DN7204_c0_g1_i2.p2 TRINITY_DN7204_c0_g1~~TRINITY_DN7204_c0_g1_i2.p2  ORF type:complete len:261 (+),score=104.89 TRINITY_DN7204_c0_g1_i2:96-878(+)